MMNLFTTQELGDAPKILCFYPWELFIGQRGGWTELLLKLNILLGWADTLHQIKVIKRQNALLNLLYHYIVLHWDDLIKGTVEPLFIWRGVQSSHYYKVCAETIALLYCFQVSPRCPLPVLLWLLWISGLPLQGLILISPFHLQSTCKALTRLIFIMPLGGRPRSALFFCR